MDLTSTWIVEQVCYIHILSRKGDQTKYALRKIYQEPPVDLLIGEICVDADCDHLPLYKTILLDILKVFREPDSYYIVRDSNLVSRMGPLVYLKFGDEPC